MTEILHEHRLDGCTPTPLANYLKALAVLRLVSTPENNVTGVAADPAARGWWEGERFHLRTTLDRDRLVRFFLEDYAPSPIIAPWNGGSGFYYREGQTGEKDPLTGKRIKTGVRDAPTEATRRIDSLAQGHVARFCAIARSIISARAVIDEFALKQAPNPKLGQKAAFMQRLRARADEQTIQWMDAALAIGGDDFDSAALLGSGGNDGNLDFSTSFHSALLTLFDTSSGTPLLDAEEALLCSLFGESTTCALAAAVSQFAPGSIAAPNSGNGFTGPERGEHWSIVFMFEGAVAFAGAATRKDEAQRPRGSFPFTVSQLASGSGAVAGDDEASSRAYEIWLPLWSRPVTFTEISALLAEGRATINRRPARDGLSFARAVATLGVNRGIAAFERLGFEARYGNMFITVPLGRFNTPDRPRPDLISDLEAGWLSRVRRLARGPNAPARAREVLRRLEDALFDMTRPDREMDGARSALMALGSVASWLVTSREGLENACPPPRLRSDWVRIADDGSAEFRVAAALASIGWPEHSRGTGTSPEADIEGTPPDEETVDEGSDIGREEEQSEGSEADLAAPPAGAAEAGRRDGEAAVRRAGQSLPMAVHFAPVLEDSIGSRRRRWAPDETRTVVWGAGGLVPNMIAVLERRLVERAIRSLDDKPFVAAAPARLADLAAFLEPGFDDARCAALLPGLVWARPCVLPWRRGEGQSPIPFAYAALKPLFVPDAKLRSLGILPQGGRLPVPPGLLARLGRGDADGAVREALARARASGLASPFDPARARVGSTRFGAGIAAERLAAALLIPIRDRDLKDLVDCAYPEAALMKETNDAA